MRLARLVGVGRMKFIDIGANLTDGMYSGDYNGTNRHQPDLAAVNMNSVSGVAMYGRLVGGDDQLVHMSTAANNSALYPKPQYHTPLGEFSGKG